jgi:hypothetical protein
VKDFIPDQASLDVRGPRSIEGVGKGSEALVDRHSGCHRCGVSIHANAEFGVLDVSGQEVLRTTIPQCFVCRHPRRDEVEAMLLRGRSPWAVLRELGDDAGLTQRHLSDHIRNQHLPPLKSAAVAIAREQTPKPLIEAAQAVVDPLVAVLAFNAAVITNVVRRMASGDLLPDIPHAQASARLTAEIAMAAADERAPHNQDMGDALMMVIDTAKDLLDRDQFEELQHRVEAHPLVARLRAERSRSSVRIGA